MTRGDYSKFTFDPSRHDAAVVMQQGRVQLDADWNEQHAIVTHRLDTTFADLIGADGAPAGNPGFAVSARSGLRFSGTGDHVRIPGDEKFVLGRAFALDIAVRIKPRASGTLCRITSEDSTEIISVRIDSSGFLDCRTATQKAQSSIALKPDTTHVVTIRYDRSAGLTVDVDARRVASSAQSTPSPTAGNDQTPRIDEGARVAAITVGASGLPGDHADGLAATVSDLRLWVVEATVEDDHKPSTLIGWWPMRGEPGPTAIDRSPSHRDGSLVAAVTGTLPFWEPLTLRIGAGRYYVGGTLVTNELEYEFDTANVLRGLPLPSGWSIAYIEVSHRTISAAEDPRIAEPALAGADTATRLRTTAKVKLLSIDFEPDSSNQIAAEDRRATDQAILALQTDPHAQAAFHRSSSVASNRLVRVEIHRSGPGDSSTADSVVVRLADDKGTLRIIGTMPNWTVGQTVFVEVHGDASERSAVVTSLHPDGRLTLSPIPAIATTGQASLRPHATFLWSTDNASTVLAIESVETGSSNSTITLRIQTPDNLRVGDLVELSAGPDTDVPSTLARIIEVTEERKVVIDTALPASPAPWLVMTRWDGEQPIPNAGALIDLSDGVSVRFDPLGRYVAGQYWLCALRSGIDNVAWPQSPTGPVLLPPHGPTHSRALLAYVWREGNVLTAIDARRVFHPAASERASLKQPDWDDHLDHWLSAESDRDSTTDLRSTSDPLLDAVPADVLDTGQLDAASGSDDGELSADVVTLSSSPDGPDGFMPLDLVVSAEPRTPGWRLRGPLRETPTGRCEVVVARSHAHVFTPDGRVLAASTDSLVDWQQVGEFQPRSEFATALLDGTVHILGGRDLRGMSKRHDAWDLANGELSKRADLPTVRTDASAAPANGHIHLIGGVDQRGKVTDRHDIYDAGGDTWIDAPSAPTPARRPGLVAMGDVVLFAGGAKRFLFWEYGVRVVAQFDSRPRAWSQRSSLPRRVRSAPMVALGGSAYVVGGRRRLHATHAVERYDAENDQWSEGPKLANALASAGIAADHAEIVVVGGHDGRQWLPSVHTLTVRIPLFLFQRRH